MTFNITKFILESHEEGTRTGTGVGSVSVSTLLSTLYAVAFSFAFAVAFAVAVLMPRSTTPLFTIRASHIARLHAFLSFTAFITALVITSSLHYTKVVKNDVAGWPEEWFPSVSATIGDWYPERNIFQILIAINSGPRFALIGFGYLLNRSRFPSSSLPGLLLVTGILRTLTCGGWVYITSSDDHDVHDVLMILYIVLNLPWMLGTIQLSRGNVLRQRFWISLPPMIYFFVRHKVHRIPGAYTHYAFFEWSLILFDILYDSVTIVDFENSGIETSINISIDRRGGQSAAAQTEIAKNLSNEPSDPSVLTKSVGEKSREAKNPTELRPETLPVRASNLFASCRPFLSFLSDLYFAYQSWTLLTALPVTLFYFSVWKLALAGPEFSTLAALSPLLLGFTPVLSFATSRIGRAALAAAAGAIGLGLWWTESMWIRLVAVMFGVSCTGIRWAAEWQADIDSGYHPLMFLLGLILSSLSKHLNHGNNPAWPIVDFASGGQHVLVLILGFLAVIEFGTRPDSPFPAALATTSLTASKHSHKSPKSTKADNPQTQTAQEPWLLPSIALGSLIYSLHERLSDPSSLLAWSWSGFPTTGPHPNVHASLTLLAQVLAVFVALTFSSSPSPSPTSPASLSSASRFIPLPDISGHPLIFAIGVLSTYLLHTRSGWVGYTGGLLHAAFLTVITPSLLHNAGVAARARGVGRVFGTAWAVWVVFLFTSTFTVAYAFVPGAWSFRERTDLMLTIQLGLLAPFFNWRSFSVSHIPPPPIPKLARRYLRASLALIAVAALIGPLRRAVPPTPAPAPTHARARILNAGIWTVHFGIDNTGHDSQRGMRDLFRDLDLDVVGLLETDLHRPVFGNRDLTRVAVEDLGYYVDIGPGPNKHTWGCVLLSKFPILKSQHHLLPSPEGELAPAIEAVIDVYGVNVTVVVAHNGQEETPLDRELQATELARIMSASYPDPLIFLGYVVTNPRAERPAPYEIMVTDGRVHDIDKEDLDRWCEYIFYRGLYRTAYARVSRGSITDTELQVGQFVVPRYGMVTGEVSEDDRYLRAWKEDLPSEHWFPDAFYGDEHYGGVRGHFYHVFNTVCVFAMSTIPSERARADDG
ncbi:Frag1/DRAM/Sfk1 family-domain-containing protein [Multifurca ochricompacta]|uniref:Frag1/DRAM/Sfk1 family-domain-containing protein n=1 Tax=Multifurca ochricompacta TaxID=376703 RepID=A0AAD4QLR3_9AGAM|nr:Frag1/DRAM/Sfk1 family-domain-containing protein [Multifurca ochricompacta]